MSSEPGPVSSITFLNSSSDQALGTLPINSLYLVSESEHLKVLPCNDIPIEKPYKSRKQTNKKSVMLYLKFFVM